MPLAFRTDDKGILPDRMIAALAAAGGIIAASEFAPDQIQPASLDLRLGEVTAPKTEFTDHVEPIRLALESERKVTVAISGLFEIARDTNDYASEGFMQWFVDEQVEEESSMDALLQVAERVREYPMMLEEFLAREGDGGDGGAETGMPAAAGGAL